jgi:hypothetical protein
LRGLDRTTFTRRLGGSLQRRGFTGSAMRHAMQIVWQEIQLGSELDAIDDDEDDQIDD